MFRCRIICIYSHYSKYTVPGSKDGICQFFFEFKEIYGIFEAMVNDDGCNTAQYYRDMERQMKRLAAIALALLLAGCATKQPVTANLDLRIGAQPATLYQNAAANIQGTDLRNDKKVIRYTVKDEITSELPTLTPPQIILKESLSRGFEGQGLAINPAARVHMTVEINELLVKVDQPQILHDIHAKSVITLKVVNGTRTLTKKYNREETKETVTKPKIAQLEKILNDQLSDIAQQILKDEDIRKTVSAI